MASEVIEGEVLTAQPSTSATGREVEVWTPKFVVSVDEAVRRRDQVVDYMRRVLRPDVHYGQIPGTGSKPTLLKPGAEALCRDMGLHPDPVVTEHVLDVDGRDHTGEPFILYRSKTNLYALDRETGDRRWVGSGEGSCNSWEDKYRWRTAARTCPECGKQAIIKGRAEYGGGWLCFAKKGGCGAKWSDGTAEAEHFANAELGKVPNDRVMDLDNTILKMAHKRSLIAAVLNVTGASDVFTQDIDDRDELDEEERARRTAPASPATSATAASAAKAQLVQQVRALVPKASREKVDAAKAYLEVATFKLGDIPSWSEEQLRRVAEILQ